MIPYFLIPRMKLLLINQAKCNNLDNVLNLQNCDPSPVQEQAKYCYSGKYETFFVEWETAYQENWAFLLEIKLGPPCTTSKITNLFKRFSYFSSD